MKTTHASLLLLLLPLTCLSPLLLLLSGAESAKILSISFLSTKSHKIVYEPLLHELAKRGHEVTIVSPFRASKEMPNLRHIQTIDPEEFEKEMSFPNLFETKVSGGRFLATIANPFLFFGGMLDSICRRSYPLPQVQAIMKEKFDLIMFTPLFNECIYGLVHHLNTTAIVISQVTVMPWVAGNFGNPSPPSFVPFSFLGYSDRMTYKERVFNFLGIVYNHLIREYYYLPKLEKVYRDLIDPNLPSVNEIEANSSIALCNSHVSFTRPKPLLPDVIDVGGMHLNPPKPVPKELEDFFSGPGAEHGFILFSMGSALKAHTMPERYQKLFLSTFSKLKQRVIWKWETETMADLPANVKLSKWLPQQDVLGHKNIRLFITHGGHGSTQEAIYHGVPLVGLPMFGDQEYNMQQSAKLGFALPLEFNDLTEQMLLDAINKVINEPSYRESAKNLAALFQDQIDKPLDRAVYWTEYVLRHKGARHLRSAGRDLSILQYYSVDVLAGIGAFLLVSLLVNLLILRACLRKCFGGSDKANAKVAAKSAKKRR